MNTTRMVYEQQLSKIKQGVHLALFEREIPVNLSDSQRNSLIDHLEKIRQEYELDFLSLTVPNGQTILRISNREVIGDDVSWMPVVKAALAGNVVAST